ncbi:replication protein A 32 kDa subunit-A-like isoform X1 [Takifugu flavidus]|uniref:replication protein A 32 kDa subunit-A-like isoform X1 n=1 Tax=Takifugu flavidus TaxID=433684 RepID=UPI002544BF77|nr:replication protein A 32 kDa subunit-A-like isoform X1 [Takifugu flavidus]
MTAQATTKRATLQILPVTVSQLLSAPQVGHDAFVIGYLELHQVSVVGVVRRSAHYDTNVQYCVDDMTGPPLLVKQWVGEEATPICPGTYVKVTGCLRGGSDQKVLLALNVRCLQELNEITSHMMEVVQAHMQLFGKAFDVNMNPTAGPGAGGVLPIGLSTIQGEDVRRLWRRYRHTRAEDAAGLPQLDRPQNFSGVLAKRRSHLLHRRPASFQVDGALVPADLDRSAAHVWTFFVCFL